MVVVKGMGDRAFCAGGDVRGKICQVYSANVYNVNDIYSFLCNA